MAVMRDVRTNRSDRLKAQGNLSYLEFLRTVQYLWTQSHPGIDLVATGTKRQNTLYPVITYRLDLRRPHPAEPKPRIREVNLDDGNGHSIVLTAQRFQTLVTFTVMTQMNPELAETIVEEFENFMLEMQPVYKELGVSELVYAHRNPDSMADREGLGVQERSITYLLTTEKIIQSNYAILEAVIANVRLDLLQNPVPIELATPNLTLNFEEYFQSATPIG